jgi:hypothetical protein
MTIDPDDPQRREKLIAKYALDQPPEADNLIVRAILDGERIVAMSTRHGNDEGALFDPAWSPTMHDLAERAHNELHRALVDGVVKCVNTAGNTLRGARTDREMYVHFVGDDRVFVCKGKPDIFASTLQHMRWLHDIGGGCKINTTDDCGGPTILLPLLRGRFLLIFECCVPCRERAGQMADNGYLIGEMEARVRLGLPPA